MGAVYVAEQSRPIKRTVALKVIKPGMDSASVVARFEAERQALAVMDHPCIARVLDGGTTDRGLPYFVMEHVKGLPMIEHCDQHKLDMQTRLRLFVRVCEAVQHAHGKGVIHRDLKPANILVSYQGDDHTPKVIDFGIAKALGGKLTEATMHTEAGAFVGTPEYMSPEQAGGVNEDVDTRADVYALGVILYELLTGARPFDAETLRKAALYEIQRIIREVDPPRPSTRLESLTAGGAGTKVAENRRTEIRSLSGVLRRDLDWVVMKCLEKDRARRYDTVDALAMEIQRYLRDEPVLAGPPSVSYRLSKFVKRNRAGVVVAGAGFLLVLAGLAGTSLGFVEATRQARLVQRALDAAEDQRARADQRAEELQLVVDFQSEQLGDIDVEMMGAGIRDAILAEVPAELEAALSETLSGINFANIAMGTLEESIFERTIDAIDVKFADQPLVRAQLLESVSDTLANLGLFDVATDPLERALVIRRREQGDEHPDTLNSIANLGWLLRLRGMLDEAEPVLREALDERRRVLGDEHPDTLESLSLLGSLLEMRGRLAEAELVSREAVEGQRRVLGTEHQKTLTSIVNLGILLQEQGRLAEAEPFMREALDIQRRVLGDDRPETLTAIGSLGSLLRAQGKLAEAEPLYRETLAGRRRVHGDQHPHTLTAIGNMGSLLRAMGRLAEAEPFYREAFAGQRRVLGDEHPHTLTAMSNMAFFLWQQGNLVEAEQVTREVLDIRRRVLGDEHPDTSVSISYLGSLLRNQGRLADAEPLVREALDIRRRVLGDEHPDTLISMQSMGSLLRDLGRLAEAERTYRDVLDGRRRVLGVEHPETLSSMYVLGDHLQRQGNLTEAESLLRDALAGQRRELGGEHPQTLNSISSLGDVLRRQGRLAEAEPLLREVLDVRRRVRGEDHADTALSKGRMAMLLNAMGRHAESETLARESLDSGMRTRGQDHWRVAESRSVLGEAIAGQGRFAEAEPMLVESYASLEASLPRERRAAKLPPAAARLVTLYDAWGKPAEADLWRERARAEAD